MQPEPYDVDPYSDVTYIQTEWDDAPETHEEPMATEATMSPPVATSAVAATPAR